MTAASVRTGGHPAESRGDVLREGFEDVQVIVDAELARYREHEGIGGLDGRIGFELLDQLVRFTRVGAAESRTRVVDDPDLVAPPGTASSEVEVVEVGGDREDAAADGHSRRPLVSGLVPDLAVSGDLFGLQVPNDAPVASVSRVELIRFTPIRAAPSAVAAEPAPHQMRRSSPGECGSTRRRTPGRTAADRQGEFLAADGAEKRSELLSSHVRGFRLGVVLVPEGFPAAQGRLGETATDAQCQPLVREQIEGGGLLGE